MCPPQVLRQLSLLDDLPPGARYQPAFITAAEEAAAAAEIARVHFSEFEMRGVVARRRVAFFGATYERVAAAPPLPAFLLPVRARLAAWAGVADEAFAMALINEYRAGAPIGWHRDAPQYGIIAGLSLLSACTIKFRPYVSPRRAPEPRVPRRAATHALLLEPRSAYLLTGEARSAYEHHIPPAAALRYSITFRTLRG